jgi:hypothetical protein
MMIKVGNSAFVDYCFEDTIERLDYVNSESNESLFVYDDDKIIEGFDREILMYQCAMVRYSRLAPMWF